MPRHGIIFNLGSAKVCSPTIIETYFSDYKNIWITLTDYYISFFLIVLFLSFLIIFGGIFQYVLFLSFLIIFNFLYIKIHEIMN